MTLNEVMIQLAGLGNEKVRVHNTKFGAGAHQFGVKMGDIRNMAKKIKTDHELALALWDTENVDARFLAILIMDPRKLTYEAINELVKSEKFPHIADWLYTYVIKGYPDTETLRKEWMESTDPMAARAGWSLTSGCIVRQAHLVDIPALLDRIETELATSAPAVQWTMNSALAQIGIHHPPYRERALAIGEKLGIYRDYPVSKGCTSPFAPIWINEMVRRQH
ncbi:DNA alkylation repair protein [Pedobacter rhizosphaerae]|uniref:3-methyladenine DNA glycosylase AlkD n=1 Tax=Pedobacter rhizosphaerae TaxID=390241 RepID=A0A1H9KP14_9SPHI|nr:DNA alkylation repair protein [Pedobacter rhizosphaerae]SER00675.1 3-methyladenine DNA glycosylase AlkD [Pedobacter rhizosphaerae]